MKKSVSKSVRMTQEVYEYVENFEGDGFNQKFSNLVQFCMKEEQSKRCIISELDKKIESYKSVLRSYDELASSYKTNLLIFEKSKKELDKLFNLTDTLLGKHDERIKEMWNRLETNQLED